MPKADILFDKTEFVLRMADKQAMTMNIRADHYHLPAYHAEETV